MRSRNAEETTGAGAGTGAEAALNERRRFPDTEVVVDDSVGPSDGRLAFLELPRVVC